MFRSTCDHHQVQQVTMEDTKIKFKAGQAKCIYLYKSLRSKILKCNADIFFNKHCFTKNIIPKYTNIKDPALF
jgi:hypothetical protein